MIKDSLYVEGLVDYIKDVKPYSSKLLDVSVEYQFSDNIFVKVTDDEHFIRSKLNTYWLYDYSYDGKTLMYKIPAAIYPRRDSDIHEVITYVVGTDVFAGIPNPLYDRTNQSTDPIYHTKYLTNAYLVKSNDGLVVKVNDVRVVNGLDYRTTYVDPKGNTKFIGVGNSVIQFLDGHVPAIGSKITVDTYRHDKIFLSFGNYDGHGHPHYPCDDATDSTAVHFVPYTVNLNPESDYVNRYYGWGGSRDLDSEANPTIPVYPTFDPTYDMEGYDTEPYEDNPPIDDYDYANGISNWDEGPWDGEEFADVGTSLVTDFYDDSYMPPSTTDISYVNRRGRLIGHVKRLTDANNQIYYAFQFDESYLTDFVPYGTKMTIGVSQGETENTRVAVGFKEELHFKELLRFSDAINVTVSDHEPSLFGYDIGEVDHPSYDWANVAGSDNSDDLVPTYTFNVSTHRSDALAASRITEELEFDSETGYYGVDYDIISYDEMNRDVLITLNDPAVTSGSSWRKSFTTPISSLRIVHNMGSNDPTGPYATYGGVKVDIVGVSPELISNPYIDNVPKLFTTTDIAFTLPSAFTITITKR